MVKRYVVEDGSPEIRRLLVECLPAASRFSEIEVASALERRCRERSIPATERDRAISALRRDFSSLLIVELTAEVVSSAMGLLSRHRLRAGDAIQLASSLELQLRMRYPVTFVAFDSRLCEAARSEGLDVEPEPTRGPVSTKTG